MIYYNTTNLAGLKLRDAVTQCRSQEAAILILFRRKKKPMTPSQVLKQLRGVSYIKFSKVPLTSIRARITTMEKNGDLVKLKLQTSGDYGRDVYYWALPSKNIVKQINLF